MFDENFFVLIPTLIFIFFAFKPAKKHLTQFLDGRAEKIKAQIDEASMLKKQAIDLLSEQKKREKEIHTEAQQILAHAKNEIERLQNDAKVQLEDILRRREQMAFTRIATAEREAMNSVKQFALQLTIDTVTKLIKEKLPIETSNRILEESIREMPEKLQLH
jgi:F-type H+-transporting ATPase subunit b